MAYQQQQQGYGYSPQQMQQYQQHQQPSQTYGSYGGYFQQNVFSCQAWQAFQFQTPDDLRNVFMHEMMKNPANHQRQAIQSEDLCNILNNTPSIQQYFRISWSRELCSIMLAMLDRSMDGFMQWEEFLELQQCLVSWHNVFLQYDRDRSGFIEPNELTQVVTNLFGYRISTECLTTILKRYSRVIPRAGGEIKCMIAFDDFVAVSVRIRAYTDAFRKRDSAEHGQETGGCHFGYDDFLRCVLCL